MPVRAALVGAVEHLWYGEGARARVGRALLQPVAWAYGAAVAVRARRCAGWPAGRSDPPIPALSVGNLTVGGTGKTPVASWAAAELFQRGGRPAIVLRGYGDDEWRVHQQLTPGAPVLTGADRLASLRSAAGRGCDCAVLDDAFQHRRAPRTVDWVLMSADRWSGAARLLPAGPFREPLEALGRASALLVTVKAAPASRVEELVIRLQRTAPAVPLAIVRLVQGALHQVAGGMGDRLSPVAPHEAGPVLVTSAIGDPAAFESQLEARGATVRQRMRFPDHHEFTGADLDRLVRAARGCAGVVCTLKDSVKLAPRWPVTAVPLWYVSQTVQVESGLEVLVGGLDHVLAARAGTVPTPG